MPPNVNRYDKLNLFVNIFALVLIPIFGFWIVWSINSKFKSERDDADKFNAATYVPRIWFMETQKDFNGKLNGLQSDVSDVKQDVANIHGQLGSTIRTRP